MLGVEKKTLQAAVARRAVEILSEIETIWAVPVGVTCVSSGSLEEGCEDRGADVK